MGSDLYWDSRNFRPRPNLMYLNRSGRWEVYQDYFMSGYKRAGRSIENTPATRAALRIFCAVTKERPGQ